MPNKTAIHPDGKHMIEFRPEPHVYEDNYGLVYTSATTYIKPFFEQFDSAAVSKKCSQGNNPKYKGRSPQDILNEWSDEANRGSSEGTNVHEYAESIMDGWEPERVPKPISKRCSSMFNQLDIFCDYLLRRFDVIGTEVIVFSPSIGIAGMIDLLLLDPENNEIIVGDFKNNKDEITDFNQYNKYAFPPIEHLAETDINIYGLQLSLYQHLLINENYFPDVSGYRRVLFHLSETSVKPIQLDYYDYEIGEMLKNGK